MIDLMSPTQEAVFEALADAIPDEVAEVLDHVPQDRPIERFVKLGAIEEENVGTKDEPRSRFEIEVHTIYRGTDRSVLLAIMHRVRGALDEQPIAAEGVDFSSPDFLGAAASDAGPDGVTYAGISTFEIYAEPA
jgi:hypothetical protein